MTQEEVGKIAESVGKANQNMGESVARWFKQPEHESLAMKRFGPIENELVRLARLVETTEERLRGDGGHREFWDLKAKVDAMSNFLEKLDIRVDALELEIEKISGETEDDSIVMRTHDD